MHFRQFVFLTSIYEITVYISCHKIIVLQGTVMKKGQDVKSFQKSRNCTQLKFDFLHTSVFCFDVWKKVDEI